MAALRSTMARLSRHSRFSSGSSAAAPTGGRAMEIPKVGRPAAERTPPVPSQLRPTPGTAAVGNLESWQRFSTEGRNKADSVVRTVGQWSKDCMRTVEKAGSEKTLFVCTIIVNVASLSFTLANVWNLKWT